MIEGLTIRVFTISGFKNSGLKNLGLKYFDYKNFGLKLGWVLGFKSGVDWGFNNLGSFNFTVRKFRVENNFGLTILRSAYLCPYYNLSYAQSNSQLIPNLLSMLEISSAQLSQVFCVCSFWDFLFWFCSTKLKIRMLV